MINKNAKLLVFLLFLLVIAVPVSFANDNATADNETLSVSNDKGIIGANDVYFDASATSDGSGSQNSPYKTVLSSRLGTTNHFASGTYRISLSLSTAFSSSPMAFIGENSASTILEYTGRDIFLSSGSDLTFNSITLKGVHIVSTGGLLTATDTIFESGVAPVEEESDQTYYDNSYGGAIKQSISSSSIDWGSIFGGSTTTGMKITNCTFKNNYASYGGAIYVEGGTCEIINTKFESNHAKHYGGAISAMNDVKLTITECEFDSDYSHYDAGGALYTFNCSTITVMSSDFTNCSATFGSAIASLDSFITISSSNARKNRASGQGGAIYAMYGRMTITSSFFQNNYAKDGGAVFADNLTYFEVIGGEFTRNSASGSAGAIFAFANGQNRISTTFHENTAEKFDDLYRADTIDLIIGSDEYEMIQYKSSYNGVLPSKFDLRSLGFLTPVKNQGQSGNCWAFASIATLESAILKATGKKYNLSEGNLKNLANRYSDIGWDYETNNGGMYPFVFGYLTSWAGPVNASLDPTDDWDVIAPILDSSVHVQNILFLQRTSFTDNSAIKKAIMDYGAVASEIYWSNSYLHGNDYYYDGDSGRNHAICVVGWDDTKTVSGAPGPGVWIIKNSYSSNRGDGGYYYVSYYDKSLFRIYDESYNSYAIVFNDTKRFNKNYQYDAAFTDYFITGNKQMWYKNTFTSTGNDILEAFSTYFRRVTTWEAQIFVNDELKLTQSGKSNFGYYTIDLESPIALKTGDNFTISLKITCNANADIPISESGHPYTLVKQYFRQGVSFFSTDGNTWTDFYGYKSSYGSGETGHNYFNQVACIKAFTSKGTGVVLNTTVEIADVNSTGITVNVYDQYGQNVNMGIVEVFVGSEKLSSKVLNGQARVNIYLKPGIHNIGAAYISNNYYASSNDFKSINLDKQTPVIIIESSDAVYPDDVKVKVAFKNDIGQIIDIPYTIEFNGVTYNNGEFKVSGLKPGNYTFRVISNATDDYNSNSISKVIQVQKFTPEFNLEIDDVCVGERISVKAVISSNISATVKVTLNLKSYEINVVNGAGSIDIENTLNAGNYLIYAELESDDYHVKVTANSNLGVYKINPNLTVSSNENGTAYVHLPNDIKGTVSLSINNKTFTSIVENGLAVFNVSDLKVGSYKFSVSFNGDDKYNPDIAYDRMVISQKENADLKVDVEIRDNDVTVNVALLSDATGNVELKFNSQILTESLINGKATFLIEKLANGNYAFFITYNGDSKYASSIMHKNVIIDLNDLTVSTILAANSTRAYLSGNDFQATFTDKYGNPLVNSEVMFIVNGNEYIVMTNQFGVAKLNEGFVPSVFDIIIVNLITGENLTRTMTIVQRIAENCNVNVDYSYSSNYRLRIYADNANPVGAGEGVIFKINGKTHEVITDSQGYAVYKISGLLPKTYTITAEYKGITVSNKVVVKQILKSGNVKVKKSSKIKKFTASLKTSAGKAIKNKKITFKIKGKTYTAKTNSKGVATIKIDKNLKVGKYTVTVKYLKTSIKKTLTIKK